MCVTSLLVSSIRLYVVLCVIVADYADDVLFHKCFCLVIFIGATALSMCVTAWLVCSIRRYVIMCVIVCLHAYNAVVWFKLARLLALDSSRTRFTVTGITHAVTGNRKRDLNHSVLVITQVSQSRTHGFVWLEILPSICWCDSVMQQLGWDTCALSYN